MNAKDIEGLQKQFEGLDAREVIRQSLQLFSAGEMALASSLAAEDQVLTSLLLQADPKARVFTLDTGRLPQETYDVMQETMYKYGFKYEVLFPDYQKVEEMVSKFGPNLFYESRDKRLLCCQLRKVEPLKRKLSTLKAWICGLRKEQSVTRADVRKIEWDSANGLVKINPLADWSEKDVWNFIKEQGIPYNKLHDQGYPSIGCAPCTRAIQPGEDIRAGRWWWENPEHKECGLHAKDAGKK